MPATSQTDVQSTSPTTLKDLLHTLATYKRLGQTLLPKSTCDSLPSEKDIPALLESGKTTLTDIKDKVILIQRRIKAHASQHLNHLQRLRNTHFVDSGGFPMASLPWYSQAADFVDTLNALVTSDTSLSFRKEMTKLITRYQAIVCEAHQSELIALAEQPKKEKGETDKIREKGVTIYEKELSYLKMITEKYGLKDTYKSGQLAFIKSIEAQENPSALAVLDNAKNIDVLIAKTQERLLKKWYALFSTEEIKQHLGTLQQYHYLCPKTFLKIAEKCHAADTEALAYSKDTWKREIELVFKNLKNLESLQSTISRTPVDTMELDSQLKSINSKAQALQTDIKRLTPNIPITSIVGIGKRIHTLKVAITSHRKQLLNLALESWVLPPMKSVRIKTQAKDYDELLPLLTSLTLSQALERARQHIRRSDTFKKAEIWFPHRSNELKRLLEQEALQESEMIPLLDAYYKFMVIVIYLKVHIKSHPALTAIEEQNEEFYEGMNERDIVALYESYQSIEKERSTSETGNHMFNCMLETSSRASQSDTKEMTLEAAREKLIQAEKDIQRMQKDMTQHKEVIQGGVLPSMISAENKSSALKLINRALQHLLNAHARYVLSKDALEKGREFSHHLSIVDKHLYFVNQQRPNIQGDITQHLKAEYQDLKTQFESLAVNIDRDVQSFCDYTYPQENTILQDLRNKQTRINQAKADISHTENLSHEGHACQWIKYVTLIDNIKQTIRDISDPIDMGALHDALKKKQLELFECYWPKLKEKAEGIQRQVQDFQARDYDKGLTDDESRAYNQGIVALQKFKSCEGMYPYFFKDNGETPTLQTLDQANYALNRELEAIEFNLKVNKRAIHEGLNHALHEQIDSLQEYDSITSPYFDDETGNLKEEEKVLWENTPSVKYLQKGLIRDINGTFHYQALKTDNEKRLNHVLIFKDKFEALTVEPQDKTNNPLYLLHLVNQVIPDLCNKIADIKQGLPKDTRPNVDIGLQSMIKLHNRLVDSKSHFLKGTISAHQFNQAVESSFKDTVLKGDVLVSLSNYHNGRLLQWFRQNRIIQALIKFFSFGQSSTPVAFASPVEIDVYGVTRRWEAAKLGQNYSPQTCRYQATFFERLDELGANDRIPQQRLITTR